MVEETQPLEDHLNPWNRLKQHVTAVAEKGIYFIYVKKSAASRFAFKAVKVYRKNVNTCIWSVSVKRHYMYMVCLRKNVTTCIWSVSWL
jgi:hypothetical protein